MFDEQPLVQRVDPMDRYRSVDRLLPDRRLSRGLASVQRDTITTGAKMRGTEELNNLGTDIIYRLHQKVQQIVLEAGDPALADRLGYFMDGGVRQLASLRDGAYSPFRF
jgi:hypothetical protein